MIYYGDSGWLVHVSKVKNCTVVSLSAIYEGAKMDGSNVATLAPVKHNTQHATCSEPTIWPFQHPRQSRTLLQFRRVAGPNMAQTLPSHSHQSDNSDA